MVMNDEVEVLWKGTVEAGIQDELLTVIQSEQYENYQQTSSYIFCETSNKPVE
jgi:hypothetical protein